MESDACARLKVFTSLGPAALVDQRHQHRVSHPWRAPNAGTSTRHDSCRRTPLQEAFRVGHPGGINQEIFLRLEREVTKDFFVGRKEHWKEQRNKIEELNLLSTEIVPAQCASQSEVVELFCCHSAAPLSQSETSGKDRNRCRESFAPTQDCKAGATTFARTINDNRSLVDVVSGQKVLVKRLRGDRLKKTGT